MEKPCVDCSFKVSRSVLSSRLSSWTMNCVINHWLRRELILQASSLIGMSFLSRFKICLNEKHPAASSEITDQMGLSNSK